MVTAACRDAPQILEQNVHVVPGRPVIHDTAAECETATEARIGKVGTAIVLQREKQTFIVGVEIGFGLLALR